MRVLPIRLRSRAVAFGHAIIFSTLLLPAEPVSAQEGPLQPGEAFVTRFSGTRAGTGSPVIDTAGTVGSIIDLRSPGQPPQGQHWVDEPQRLAVSAGEIGQVFGVVLDDANPPNIYLAATSAFGLHRAGNNWMPGMWGEGGPGGIYRLDAANGYTPQLFSTITLNGRPNGGPALGNLAYDRANKQLFVSDLETGMIHRIRVGDGSDAGTYDHGTQGRTNFMDVETGQTGNLPPITFDPNSSPRTTGCPGQFDRSPQCWNYAASGRRVWGLAVHRNPANNETRLYYSVWSGPAFDLNAWNQQSEDDKRNSVWSVKLGPDGNFAGDVRREFIMPDFFNKSQDFVRAGYSSPVSDIHFATCGPRPIMLLAERGGIRNLGLAAENPFAFPHEARALRYELDRNGSWRAVGRYDVGFYDREKEGDPRIRANCAGGIAFGPGYNDQNTADPNKPDQFVWITGDSLCSPEGTCNLPGAQGQTAQQGRAPAQQKGQQQSAQQTSQQQDDPPMDESQVHGLQGLAETGFEEMAPPGANPPAQKDENAGAAIETSYMIDTDINVDAQGRVIEQELQRNDATKIGDVAIYEVCDAPASYAANYLLQPEGDTPVTGHHYRYGSHSTYWSHSRFGSHNTLWSHNRQGSHNRRISHSRFGSHDRRLSHRRFQSHERSRSHWRSASHDRGLSHRRQGSHNQRSSHARQGSHNQRSSHSQRGSHNTAQSRGIPKNTHNSQRSHNASGSHSRNQSAGPQKSGGQTKAQKKFTPKQQFVPKKNQGSAKGQFRRNNSKRKQ